MSNDVSAVVTERRAAYGPPLEDFSTAEALSEIWRTYRDRQPSLPEKQERALRKAVDMLFTKITRAAVSPLHRDHWVDIAGYARCVETILYDNQGETETGEP